MFRASRDKRGPDVFLAAKVGIFCIGAVIALIGIATDTDWVITLAIAVLLVGFALRFVRPRDTEDEGQGAGEDR